MYIHTGMHITKEPRVLVKADENKKKTNENKYVGSYLFIGAAN